MSYKDISTVIERLNQAAKDLALSAIAHRNGNNSNFDKHTRDAGEALSQSIEFALRHHLFLKMSNVEKRSFDLERANIKRLSEFYFNEGQEADYYYETYDEATDSTVNFDFFVNSKFALTNAAKHKGWSPDYSIQLKYYKEVIKFVTQYLGPQAGLKNIEDFERIDISNWEQFYVSCDQFIKEEHNYILIIGKNPNIAQEYLRLIGTLPWDLVIDFDYNSRENGFYKAAYSLQIIPPHQLKVSDIISVNSFSPYASSHYHYYVNNFKNSGQQEIADYDIWNRVHGRSVENAILSFVSAVQAQKTTIVALFPSRKYISNLFTIFSRYLGSDASYVIANDPANVLEQNAKDVFAKQINIGIPEIALGAMEFASNFGVESLNEGQYLIPYLENSETKDVTGILSKEEFAMLEENFEVLHLNLPDQTDNSERLEFLAGKRKISWGGLRNRFDAERQRFFAKYVRPVERQIENGRGKIFLHHEAGFGGTTVARRIAWEIHNQYPTLILKKFREGKIKEQILFLHTKTRKTIFVVLEVPQTISLDEAEFLSRSITRPVVFLIVKRGKPGINDLTVTDWGNDVPVLVKVYKPYIEEYRNAAVRQAKFKALDEIILSQESYKKTPFYIGLLTFEENFLAIKDFVANFLFDISQKPQHRKVLAYLSLVDEYLGVGLPSSFFKTVFHDINLKNAIFQLEDFFESNSAIVTSLLTSERQGKQKIWRIRHPFLSKEIKKQLLSGNSENSEEWRVKLSNYSIQFIEDSVGNISSEFIDQTLQKLFIGSKRDRAGEDFTPIIQAIPTKDEKEQVFLALKNAYPDNPHFCSHLARFYAYLFKNTDKALQYSSEAIQLSEMNGVEDPLLHHIKGMCLRSIATDLMAKHRQKKAYQEEIDQLEYEKIIHEYVPEAEAEFVLSREISRKQNREDEYGYVAHIQLLVRAIDYGIAISGAKKANFISTIQEPFSTWLDTAESLLEDLMGITKDDSNDEVVENCHNELNGLYENFDLILQNLRNQLKSTSNPGRVRRQIVRTYIHRDSNYQRSTDVVKSIMELMEANIDNEADREKDYFLWFQAARYSKETLANTLVRTQQWKAKSATLNAVFYYAILMVFRALEGYTEAAIEAEKLLNECKARDKNNTIYEWYGQGRDLQKMINRNYVNNENKSQVLEFVKGTFTDYEHDGSGKITIAGQLKVFFLPTQAKLTSLDINKNVEFYLGFSHDGLRADSSSVRLLNNETLSKPIVERKEFSNDIKKKNAVISNNAQQRLTGIVADLQYPPFYSHGWIVDEADNMYFFHKDNEHLNVFSKLGINTPVKFSVKDNKGKPLAFDISIVEDAE